MDIFKNIRIYKEEELVPELPPVLYFCDEQDRDWYETRKSWQGAVAVNGEGLVCSVARSQAEVERFTMVEGQTLYQVDPSTIPDYQLGTYNFDGENYALNEVTSGSARTKEDILADLDKLRAELTALSD